MRKFRALALIRYDRERGELHIGGQRDSDARWSWSPKAEPDELLNYQEVEPPEPK